MTGPPPSEEPTLTAATPLKFFTVWAHFFFLATLGAFILGGLFSTLLTGVSTLLAGVGVILLVGCLYAIFGLSWFEYERVNGLYKNGIQPLSWISSGERTFVGWLKSLWLNLSSSRMWLGFLSFCLNVILGLIALVITTIGIWCLVQSFAIIAPTEVVSPLPFSHFPANYSPLMLLGTLGAAGALWGLTQAHRGLATSLLGAVSREKELVRQIRRSSAQRAGAVRAADVERTRIERDLHDGVQPRLVSVAMTLGLAKSQLRSNPDAAEQLIDEAHASTKTAITELRQLSRGIYASVLADRGLDAALSALAARSHIPVEIDSQIHRSTGCSSEAEAAMYFTIAEAITNATKHSKATGVRVILRQRTDLPPNQHTLWARIEDNGVGGAVLVPGGGLDGLSNRVTAAGGTLTIDSPTGGPTTLEVALPCAS